MATVALGAAVGAGGAEAQAPRQRSAGETMRAIVRITPALDATPLATGALPASVLELAALAESDPVEGRTHRIMTSVTGWRTVSAEAGPGAARPPAVRWWEIPLRGDRPRVGRWIAVAY